MQHVIQWYTHTSLLSGDTVHVGFKGEGCWVVDEWGGDE
jgi:hypothetical protein